MIRNSEKRVSFAVLDSKFQARKNTYGTVLRDDLFVLAVFLGNVAHSLHYS